ncbi:MAG: D-alanine--D-alanine ligase [Erysipelotrichia bacterium]|nr:D-alanine--D-alanine ligase [Erysipelotrichia bacterium]NCC53927.1 D-alanine--D-alanine ligase [Erysipelotrichia bacterium]
MIHNIAVIFGGDSCEHEISILSAMQIMNVLKKKYHVIPIYVAKDSQMYTHSSLMDIHTFQNHLQMKKRYLCTLFKQKAEVYVKNVNYFANKQRIDFVFPILHGKFGEDGSIQGYLNMLHVAYAGCDVLASATCMSKIRSKQLLAYHHIATLDFAIVDETQKEMPFLPCIIKPDGLGSSIGIAIVKEEAQWKEELEKALLFDERCLVEPYIEQFIEINCSVRKSDGEVILSMLECVQKEEEILSFHDKYEKETSNKTRKDRVINPILDEVIEKQVKGMAVQVYEKLGLDGVIRIDFICFNEKVYVNEINTIPGSYAFYLWQENFLTLLESVMKESLFHYQKQACKITSFASDVLFHFHGNKYK